VKEIVHHHYFPCLRQKIAQETGISEIHVKEQAKEKENVNVNVNNETIQIVTCW
jgi:hypothetical protein